MSGRYRQASGIISMTSGNSLYLLAEPTPHRFVPVELTSSAREIWDECGSRRTVTEIVGILSLKYGVEVSAVRSEVEAFIEQLVSYELLVKDDSYPLLG